MGYWIKPMIWVICGGRDFNDAKLFDLSMRHLVGMRGKPTRVVHGAAKGADTFTGNWAREMEIDCISCPARWNVDGKAAGPLRNERMLLDWRPDLVIAFPGGRGTNDMKARAHRAGIEVVDFA
jgi:hypothetical protein